MLLNKQRLNSRNRCQAASIIIEDLNLQKKFHTVVHPFREGNTRTTITFCCQFADEKGFPINRKLFEENAEYVRTALVAYNAYFADGSNFSKPEYLEKIVYDSLYAK